MSVGSCELQNYVISVILPSNLHTEIRKPFVIVNMIPISGSKVIHSFQFKNMFPHDIVIQILLCSSPWDLLQIQRTSRYFRALLDQSQYIWRAARKSLDPPVPDPTLPDNLHHHPLAWTEAAYTNYIFGNTTSSKCGDELTEPLVVTSYSLRLFLCSKTIGSSAIYTHHLKQFSISRRSAGSGGYHISIRAQTAQF
ncbi:hypothetical protein BD410DRAFT_280621 [Rickenella mellea]|uniref:F-box domain-containing protein n=1 Tax=Rickenella mellea TaxID=50990 RepID=A0A4Y7Q2G0_9AGAM|nr:hypothetical protein BD410DRAFT_280621 [Rickenella mellea]